jgi:hypothetical protein
VGEFEKPFEHSLSPPWTYHCPHPRKTVRNLAKVVQSVAFLPPYSPIFSRFCGKNATKCPTLAPGYQRPCLPKCPYCVILYVHYKRDRHILYTHYETVTVQQVVNHSSSCVSSENYSWFKTNADPRSQYCTVKDRPMHDTGLSLALWAGTRSAGPYKDTCLYTRCGKWAQYSVTVPIIRS